MLAGLVTLSAIVKEISIESLITDLAFILILGAVVTLLFKWIKQPVVLGYIVAGFLASPNFTLIPSVADEGNIEFWAQIGIIVLLFSLGLEFSFKKLVNTGGSAVVTALIIVIGMMATGFVIGKFALHFTVINSLFLGGMLSMSSTTIIIKAFNDLGLKQKKFASLVFAVLIVEDLFAVVMMVVLSSIAVNNSVEGSDMLMSISKLVFFLVIWFLVGVFVLPTFLNKTRRFLNNETLLIVSMGLCLGMAVFSVICGFSLALGAFVMGSILAGTSLAERIEKVTMPVKDLFGSVFFISVGMMVQPDIIVRYWPSILLLSVVVIVGMIVFGSAGMLLTGQSLRVAIESGFSLTQIGEFAFIIATLGMSLGVLDASIYPIVVAVSVLTTFTTPYFIKMADPFYRFVESRLPAKLHFLIDRYSTSASSAISNKSERSAFMQRQLSRVLIYSIILIAIILVSDNYFLPWLKGIFPEAWKWLGVGTTLLVMSPFLLALSLPVGRKKNKGQPSFTIPVVILSIFKVVLVLAFIVYFLGSVLTVATGVLIGIGIILIILMFLSGRLRSNMKRIESTFMNNLNERELRASGKNNLIVSDLHLAYMRLGYKCPFVGQRLRDSGLRSRYGVSVASITRGSTVIPVPEGDTRLFPGDVIGVIGTDEEIGALLEVVHSEDEEDAPASTNHELIAIELSDKSPLIGRTIVSANIGKTYSALVIALKRNDDFIEPLHTAVFQPGDEVWIVADKKTGKALQG